MTAQADKPQLHTKWMPITNVEVAKDDIGNASKDENIPPNDWDMPGGARLWRLKDVAGNIYKGRRTRWNTTGWAAENTNQPLTPAFYAELHDVPVEEDDTTPAAEPVSTKAKRGA